MYKCKDGLAQIPLLISFLVMAAALPLVTKLVQESTDNRSKATTNLQPSCSASVCPETIKCHICSTFTSSRIKGDFDCDGTANFVDFSVWKELFFNSDCAGIVTLNDFSIWKTNVIK